MILLRLISWPYFRKHVLRTLLTTAGIVLGVAVFVGMHTANQSVLFAFNRTVDRIAGKTELQVTAGETGFDESVLETVQGAPSVRVAVPVIEATVDSQIAGQGTLLVLGVDMTGDRSLRDYDLDSADEAIIDDPLVFLAQPDSIIVTREFADRNGIALQSTAPARHGARRAGVHRARDHEVVGSVDAPSAATWRSWTSTPRRGCSAAAGRSIASTSACSRAARSRRRRRSCARCSVRASRSIRRPAAGQQFEAMTAAYSVMVSISSLFALFIGMFIIYNSFAIAVTQRRSEIGILRALGATRQQIRALFLAESAVTGLIGSIGGLLFGLLIARGIAASIGTLLERRVRRRAAGGRDCDQPGAARRSRSPIGVATSIVAALIPALAGGARRSGAGAAEGQVPGAVGRRKPDARRRPPAILAAVSIGCLMVGESRTVFYVGYTLAILAVLLLGPLLSLALARAIRPLLKWRAPGRGRARRRQPDPGAAPDVGQRRGADAVARARRRVCRHGARQLRVDHRLDGHDAQPGPVRHAVAGHRDPDAALSARDGSRAEGDARHHARPGGPQRARGVPEDAGDDRRDRHREHRRNGARRSDRRRRRHDVCARRRPARD